MYEYMRYSRVTLSIDTIYTAMVIMTWQTAVTVHLVSQQLLLFVCGLQNGIHK